MVFHLSISLIKTVIAAILFTLTSAIVILWQYFFLGCSLHDLQQLWASPENCHLQEEWCPSNGWISFHLAADCKTYVDICQWVGEACHCEIQSGTGFLWKVMRFIVVFVCSPYSSVSLTMHLHLTPCKVHSVPRHLSMAQTSTPVAALWRSSMPRYCFSTLRRKTNQFNGQTENVAFKFSSTCTAVHTYLIIMLSSYELCVLSRLAWMCSRMTRRPGTTPILI